MRTKFSQVYFLFILVAVMLHSLPVYAAARNKPLVNESKLRYRIEWKEIDLTNKTLSADLVSARDGKLIKSLSVEWVEADQDDDGHFRLKAPAWSSFIVPDACIIAGENEKVQGVNEEGKIERRGRGVDYSELIYFFAGAEVIVNDKSARGSELRFYLID